MNITPITLKDTRTFEITATICFTEEDIKAGKSFTYEELLEGMTVADEVVEVDKDLLAAIVILPNHNEAQVIANIKQRFPNKYTDEAIKAAFVKARA